MPADKMSEEALAQLMKAFYESRAGGYQILPYAPYPNQFGIKEAGYGKEVGFVEVGDWLGRLPATSGVTVSFPPPPQQLISVKVKKLHPDAKPPVRANWGDAGYDLCAMSVEQRDNGLVVVHTGIAIEPPEGWWFEMVPRSSICKRGWALANSVGIIDQGYRNEIMAMFTPLRPNPEPLQPGERVVQLIPRQLVNAWFLEVDELSDSDRGQGGFGSTGK